MKKLWMLVSGNKVVAIIITTAIVVAMAVAGGVVWRSREGVKSEAMKECQTGVTEAQKAVEKLMKASEGRDVKEALSTSTKDAGVESKVSELANIVKSAKGIAGEKMKTCEQGMSVEQLQGLRKSSLETTEKAQGVLRKIAPAVQEVKSSKVKKSAQDVVNQAESLIQDSQQKVADFNTLNQLQEAVNVVSEQIKGNQLGKLDASVQAVKQKMSVVQESIQAKQQAEAQQQAQAQAQQQAQQQAQAQAQQQAQARKAAGYSGWRSQRGVQGQQQGRPQGQPQAQGGSGGYVRSAQVEVKPGRCDLLSGGAQKDRNGDTIWTVMDAYLTTIPFKASKGWTWEKAKAWLDSTGRCPAGW